MHALGRGVTDARPRRSAVRQLDHRGGDAPIRQHLALVHPRHARDARARGGARLGRRSAVVECALGVADKNASTAQPERSWEREGEPPLQCTTVASIATRPAARRLPADSCGDAACNIRLSAVWLARGLAETVSGAPCDRDVDVYAARDGTGQMTTRVEPRQGRPSLLRDDARWPDGVR